MKLDAARIVLRPRSLSELLDLALRVSNGPAAWLFAKLALVSLLPAWGLCMAARWSLGWSWVGVWFLALALALPLQGLFTVAVGHSMFSEQVRVRAVLRAYLRRLPAYLGTLLLSTLLLGVASLGIFVVFPPFWMWARVAYVHEASLLEQASPAGAISRAARLIARNVMGTIGLLALMSLAALAFVCITELLVNDGLFKFVLQVGKPFGSLTDDGGSAAAVLGLLLAVPYWATVRYLAYIDVRTRRDGWDVQLRFLAIQSRLEAEARARGELPLGGLQAGAQGGTQADAEDPAQTWGPA